MKNDSNVLIFSILDGFSTTQNRVPSNIVDSTPATGIKVQRDP